MYKTGWQCIKSVNQVLVRLTWRFCPICLKTPHVAGKPDREKALFTTRRQVSITNETVKDKAGYSYKKLVAALGREFK